MRDDTNYIQEQRCLFGYFKDRENIEMLKMREKMCIVTENSDENFKVKYVNEPDKHFSLKKYCFHNIIVDKLRRDKSYTKKNKK